MRSVIKDADEDGIDAIVDQQFEYAARIAAAGLVPILEPEVSIDQPAQGRGRDPAARRARSRLEALPDDTAIMLKLTIPTKPGRTPTSPPTRGSCGCSPCPAATAATRRARCWPGTRA